MNVEITHRVRPSSTWKDEVGQLLAQPIVVTEAAYREGNTIGLRLSPQPAEGGATVDLRVSLFSLALAPPTAEEAPADPAALAVFLQGLQDPDLHVRLSACEALGQLGHPSTRLTLQTLLREGDPVMRAAAERALTLLDSPRIRRDDFAGIRLFLWRQTRHLWKPLKAAVTNPRGEASFVGLPPEGVYRLQLLGSQQRGHGAVVKAPTLTLFAEPSAEQECLPQAAAAASDSDEAAPAFPQSHRLALDDGSLICTLYLDDEGLPVLAFRSDAPSLKGGVVSYSVRRQRTGELECEGFVNLLPDTRGVLTGRVTLSDDRVKRIHTCEIQFDPVPGLQQSEE
jgi:hypothetical protein